MIFCAALVIEQVEADGAETILDFLETGEEAVITIGTYFYLPSM